MFSILIVVTSIDVIYTTMKVDYSPTWLPDEDRASKLTYYSKSNGLQVKHKDGRETQVARG